MLPNEIKADIQNLLRNLDDLRFQYDIKEYEIWNKINKLRELCDHSQKEPTSRRLVYKCCQCGKIF